MLTAYLPSHIMRPMSWGWSYFVVHFTWENQGTERLRNLQEHIANDWESLMPERRSAFSVVAELLGKWVNIRRRDNGYLGILSRLAQSSSRVAVDTHCGRGRIPVHQTAFLYFLGTGITFLASFAIRDGYVTVFWPIECAWEWCIPLSSPAPKTVSCRILHAWPFPLLPYCCLCARPHCCKCRALMWKEPGFLGSHCGRLICWPEPLVT